MGRTQPLPFHIDYQASPGALRAHVTGTKGSIDVTLAYWKAIATEVRRLHPRTLMVIDQMQGDPLPTEHMDAFFESMAGQGLDDVRVAFVEAQGTQVAHVEVAEILARERGFEARVFGNEADASLWLRHGAH